MFASLFVLHYVAHLLSDYPLQTDHQAAHKAGAGVCGWRANAAHATTHLAVSTIALAVGVAVLGLDVNPVAAAAGVVWIGVTHSVIDRRWPVARWMAFARQAGFAQHGGAAHVDQTAHLTALVVAALAIAGLS
ncbi:DUF3307 domain-containing protein [Streptomyces sp. AcE210]|uniref:DUF3307 domain-containing protein n=1 Tax=Streptomyces sp. AcE210 TaxID=2292703 RepID=UPI000E307AAA|nr:DUF3307 domain-containing protein [Streptomyces sp. AcE210]RFC72310.1 DUF3307 domain-containing protein [Streptomyces sp. AcE210]